jgi:non-lysosomal glucosylceramidase
MTAPLWPVLKHYDSAHLRRIAMPIGGIGTGTVSLGGRGDLRDWEIMNRPAKGFIPKWSAAPFFAINLRGPDGKPQTRILEGPLDLDDYEGASGSPAANHGWPRFRSAAFSAAYPFGQVLLSDPDLPVRVTLQAFNPLIPANTNDSSLPVAILRYTVENTSTTALTVSVCGSLPNFIGNDGTLTGAKSNRNLFHSSADIQGIFMKSEGVPQESEAWGTLALVTSARTGVSQRCSWNKRTFGWGSDLLGFWDDFNADGILDVIEPGDENTPMGSLAIQQVIQPGESHSFTFILAWHFPTRNTWTPEGECANGCCAPGDRLTNFYAVQFVDAWDAAEHTARCLEQLEADSLSFVQAFCSSDLPAEVKESALFNLSTLRSQTCFRSADGRFYAWEGCGDHAGCCYGSCTHVWNYEQATAFLFGDLARIMREIEFNQSTDQHGLMSFRVNLPIERGQNFNHAAADGQLGTIMKVYRDWQLSGDEALLRGLWPNVKKAMEFCWLKGSWDGDQDGVMEGCQHNTMDVEYYGPNPQMQIWYLGALRAAEWMARYLGETNFADECQRLFKYGSAWTDANLFNGEYYEHQIWPIQDSQSIYPGLQVGMGSRDLSNPEYQLGPGCLVDQLVGQFMAHVCGLGYLLDPQHVATTLQSILKYNHRDSFNDHFNCMRSYVLADEAALLMASYPHARPKNPFPYFTEVMTGFEYTAAVGMIYEGQVEAGLGCIRDVRNRYDGQKRSPFDEAECGHHYARAMASWAGVLALTGFQYSGVTQTMTFAKRAGTHFWSNGSAWGTVEISQEDSGWSAELNLLWGELTLKIFALADSIATPTEPIHLTRGGSHSFHLH